MQVDESVIAAEVEEITIKELITTAAKYMYILLFSSPEPKAHEMNL